MRRDRVLHQVLFWVVLSIVIHVVGGVATKKATDGLRILPFGDPTASNSDEPMTVEFTPVHTPQPVVLARTPSPVRPDEETLPVPVPEHVPPRLRPRTVRVKPPEPVVVTPVLPEVPQVPQLTERPKPPPPDPANMQHVSTPDDPNPQPRPNDPAFLANSNHDTQEQTIAALRDMHSSNSNESHMQANDRPHENTPGDSTDEVSAEDRDQAGLWLPPTESRQPDPRPQPTSATDRTTPHEAVPATTPATESMHAGSPNATTAAPTGPAHSQPQPAGATALENTSGHTPSTSLEMPDTHPNVNVLTSNGGTESLGAPPTNVAAGAAGGSQNPNTGSSGDRGTSHLEPGVAAQRMGIAGAGASRAIEAALPTHAQFGVVFGAQADAIRHDNALRRSQARGSMSETNWEANRSAIENYTPDVRVGNQTSLRTAQSPFSNYLTAMHQRIHRLFALGFIPGLQNVPEGSPLADFSLVTTLEIVLEADGRLSKLGVVRSSGSTAFDVGSLNSIRRAAPFGAAPEAIQSGDHKVYMHWAFYRNERQCGTFNAEPFILANPGGALPVHTAPPAATGHNPTDGPARRVIPREATAPASTVPAGSGSTSAPVAVAPLPLP